MLEEKSKYLKELFNESKGEEDGGGGDEVISSKIPKEDRWETTDLKIKGTIERHNLYKEEVDRYKIVLRIDESRLDYIMGVFEKTCLKVFEKEETEDIMRQVFTDCTGSKKVTLGFYDTFIRILSNKGKSIRANVNEPKQSLAFYIGAEVILRTDLIARKEFSLGSLENIKELQNKRILERIKDKNKEVSKLKNFALGEARVRKIKERKEIQDKVKSLNEEVTQRQTSKLIKNLGIFNSKKGNKGYRLASYINVVTFTDKSFLG